MLQIYLNFHNETKAVIAFYEEVFQTKCLEIMTFAEAPQDPEYPTPEEWKPLVINARMEIEGTSIMFSDTPEGMGPQLTTGNNISLVINSSDETKIDRIFAALSEGGQIEMPLAQTFWSPKYGALVDKYGINWMLNLEK